MAKKTIKPLKSPVLLSVIIPACNEAANLPVLLKSLDTDLALSTISYEIIVINDGSSDDSGKILKAYSRSAKFSVITNPVSIGKSLSVLSGYPIAKGSYIALIDADMSECSDKIQSLFELAQSGYAITENSSPWYKKWFNSSPVRGPKIFPRYIFEHIDANHLNNWNIESELIHTADNLSLTPHYISCRLPHSSRPKNLRTKTNRLLNNLKTKLRHLFTSPVYIQSPSSQDFMVGAGVTFRRQSFVTHSTLPHHLSALKTFAPWQVGLISVLVGSIGWGLVVSTIPTLIVLTSVLSFIYLVDVIFNMYVTLKSLHFPPELTFTKDQISNLKDKDLPIYSILVPLYKEAGVLPHFITSMQKLDYPTQKLDILLLLEEGDDDTINAAKTLNLPSHYRIIIVPKSSPKTKPKACNYGLSFVKGEYTVIYDAEDRPDPLQLKKAYLALCNDETIGCVQAKLNYFNPGDNLLTRFFTAEYSLWFDVILPGLQSINTSIPLGGTSNHFKTSVLRQLHGWDAFNVTEDADLGTRLFNAGYHTAIIDSTTLEEANSNWRNWVRQRSRWLKGYMQTYLVHMRDPIKLFRAQGVHALLFNLIVGGKISFILINPFLWVMTISYFALYAHFGAFIESIYPASIFYIAVISLLFGNFIALYNYMIGCSKRGHWELVKYVYLIPFYWLAISYAAAVALWQLIVKPHYWEKTIHGLDLQKAKSLADKSEKSAKSSSFIRGKNYQKIADRVTTLFQAGGIMVLANIFANFMNFLYNAHLSRHLGVVSFGDISLFGSFLYLSSIPLSGISRTLTHTTSFVVGKYQSRIKSVWIHYQRPLRYLAFSMVVLWLISTPFLKNFFQVQSITPLLFFAPIWLTATLGAGNSGYLSGNLLFGIMAISVVLEASIKFIIAVIMLEIGQPNLVYLAIPISLIAAFILELSFIRRAKTEKITVPPSEFGFSRRFYVTSVITTLSSISYLTLDVMLAKHYLSPSDAGAYSYLSLAGKMVFFLGSMFSQFLIPYVSRDLGAGRSSRRSFIRIVGLVAAANLVAVIAFGFLGHLTAPILWGSNAELIIPYLPIYSVAMAFFSLSSLIITYQQLRRRYVFPILGFGLSLLQVIGMLLVHDSINSLVWVVAISALTTFLFMCLATRFYDVLVDLGHASLDFFGLFKRLPPTSPLPGEKLRILIFNWRDLRHKWAGGAEVYLHELSKRWVEDGHRVTIFSGNDGHSSRFERVDGVSVVRRGGFYLVYLWAFLYYFFRLRGRYDVIIDSENGLPFFTPIYAREPVILLIHHVHQEVFRKSLIPPFSWLAQFLEKRIMPLVYRKTEVITVSPSSKADIISHKLTKKVPHIIYNGVNLSTYIPSKKAKNPSVLYLGRLTTAKSIHTLLRAVEQLKIEIPNIECLIAGDGPARKQLEKLANQLKIKDNLKFLGKVSEEEKIKLYQKAWVFVNPSLIEGWGITTIEANACGTPVVASNVPGLRDAVSDTNSGILVPYGQVSGFVIAISAILKDSKLRTKLSLGAISWAQKFDWHNSAKKSLLLLNTIYEK